MSHYVTNVIAEMSAFLGALKAQACDAAKGDSAKSAVIESNILKLHGFPVGVIWPEAVQQAIMLNAGPLTGPASPSVVQSAPQMGQGARCRCRNPAHHAENHPHDKPSIGVNPFVVRAEKKSHDNETEELSHGRFLQMEDLRRTWLRDHEATASDNAADDFLMEAATQFVNRFIHLRNIGQLRAEAWSAGQSPFINGVYRGRIPQIDPFKFNVISPIRNGSSNHNMTNITYPSLNEVEEAIDLDTLTDEDFDLELDLDPELGDDDAEEGMDIDDKQDDTSVDGAFEEDSNQLSTYGDPAIADDHRGVQPITMRQVDGETVVAVGSRAPSAWWKGLPINSKRRYLERHPRSRYAKAYKRAVARKRAKAKRGTSSGKGASAPPVVQDLDRLAAQNATDLSADAPIEEELSNAQDEQMDELLEAADTDGDGAIEDDEKDGKEPPVPVLDSSNVRAMDSAAARPGFFKPIVSAVKKRASESTLGAMGRFMTGNMKEDDQSKVVKGLTTAATALMVVGVSAGVGLLFGPGMMAQFANDYVAHVKNGNSPSGEDFDFGSGDDLSEDELNNLDADSEDDEGDEGDDVDEELRSMSSAHVALNADTEEDDDRTEEEKAEDEANNKPASDEQIENMTKGFLAWLIKKNNQHNEDANA